jgi:hypothetical protein
MHEDLVWPCLSVAGGLWPNSRLQHLLMVHAAGAATSEQKILAEQCALPCKMAI